MIWKRSRPARSVIAILSVAVMVFGLAACGDDSDSSASDSPAESDEGPITLVSPTEADQLLTERDDLVVIDVRTPEEFDEGHLEGATLIDFYEDDFADRIAELNRDAAYVVYCKSGNRSAQATELMADQGFTEVYEIDGGFEAWNEDGLPVV